jgi:hypothetical protein
MLDPDMLEARDEVHNLSCPHIVRVQHVLGDPDFYGSSTYGPVTEYGCRVEKRIRLMVDHEGNTRTSEGRIVFASPFPVIDVNDIIQIPQPDASYKTIGSIMSISQDPTGAGQRPTVVYY